LGSNVLLRAQWAPLVHEANAENRIAWWRQARFGMFLHWGVYAIPARGEWVMWNEQIPVGEYAKLADQFHPEHFDPNAWAALAKEGGMKYMVLTARHHDGFALFDDPGSSFTSVKSAAQAAVELFNGKPLAHPLPASAGIASESQTEIQCFATDSVDKFERLGS